MTESFSLGAEELQLRLIRGTPTDEELAAVTAVLAAAVAESAEAPAPAPVESAWKRSQRAMRSEVRPGPGRWRSGPR